MDREALRQRRFHKVVEVPVPEWGGEIHHVRGLTAKQQMDVEQRMEAAGTDRDKLVVIQLSAWWCDEHGEPVFSEEELASWWGSQDPAALARLVKAGAAANGLNPKDVEGNSQPSPPAA